MTVVTNACVGCRVRILADRKNTSRRRNWERGEREGERERRETGDDGAAKTNERIDSQKIGRKTAEAIAVGKQNRESRNARCGTRRE